MPAGRKSSGNDSVCAKATIPACEGDPVSERTSSGNATLLARVPTVETTCPVHRNRKSRFRRRGGGAWLGCSLVPGSRRRRS
jgi:hypothetical protein